jgi:RimJ/RimL family protein N-acetyltransferase
MEFSIHRLHEVDAWEITSWAYDPSYAQYDLSPDSLSSLLAPQNRYHAVVDERGVLVGYCCFGPEARVPGGDYAVGEPEVLDIGVGLRPDMTGQGHGREFIAAILAFAIEAYSPAIFRVTIAGFNHRSRRAFEVTGFEVSHHFERSTDGMKFVQLERRL